MIGNIENMPVILIRGTHRIGLRRHMLLLTLCFSASCAYGRDDGFPLALILGVLLIIVWPLGLIAWLGIRYLKSYGILSFLTSGFLIGLLFSLIIMQNDQRDFWYDFFTFPLLGSIFAVLIWISSMAIEFVKENRRRASDLSIDKEDCYDVS